MEYSFNRPLLLDQNIEAPVVTQTKIFSFYTSTLPVNSCDSECDRNSPTLNDQHEVVYAMIQALMDQTLVIDNIYK